MQNVPRSLSFLESTWSQFDLKVVFSDGGVGCTHSNEAIVVVLWIQLTHQSSKLIDVGFKYLFVLIVIFLFLLLFLLLTIGAER